VKPKLTEEGRGARKVSFFLCVVVSGEEKQSDGRIKKVGEQERAAAGEKR